ncbi:hypothetical protein CEXT_635451 [Caerostris extrusa]|uniref:Uncharacterized protein n=1 Tax=Caerostris extrusa TaxID=172846 RepID=A0AAV4XPY7_CAEEX|nr:hypothetical protein CEXT_635451 [Caerostris extrusa]
MHEYATYNSLKKLHFILRAYKEWNSTLIVSYSACYRTHLKKKKSSKKGGEEEFSCSAGDDSAKNKSSPPQMKIGEYLARINALASQRSN